MMNQFQISISNGIIVAVITAKRDEVSSFPSFPPPIDPVRPPPNRVFFDNLVLHAVFLPMNDTAIVRTYYNFI